MPPRSTFLPIQAAENSASLAAGFPGSSTTQAAQASDPLYELALDLLQLPDLAALAHRTVSALTQLLPQRGVHLQLWSRASAGGIVNASGGPEMSTHLHSVVLLFGVEQVGEIVVDRIVRPGCAWGEGEEQMLERVARLIACAAGRMRKHERDDQGRGAALIWLARLCGARLRDARVELSARLCAQLAQVGGERIQGVDALASRPELLHDAVCLVGARHLLEPDRLAGRDRERSRAEVQLALECAEQLAALCREGQLESGDLRFLLAAEILENLDERFDGSGPQGRAGRELPFAVRAYAVVSSWLESDGRASNVARRLQLLQVEAGARLDPRLVDLFVRLPAHLLDSRAQSSPAA